MIGSCDANISVAAEATKGVPKRNVAWRVARAALGLERRADYGSCAIPQPCAADSIVRESRQPPTMAVRQTRSGSENCAGGDVEPAEPTGFIGDPGHRLDSAALCVVRGGVPPRRRVHMTIAAPRPRPLGTL